MYENKCALECIHPVWPAPANIIAGVTTRSGGFGKPPYDTLNLALHVGDDETVVLKNRKILKDYCTTINNGEKTVTQWQWLNQTHSAQTHLLSTAPTCTVEADACVSATPNMVCTVLTADCLPILLCDANGTAVAAIHAGWRGLANGIVENTVAIFRQALNSQAGNAIYAWLGPAIGPGQFEVGKEVKEAFMSDAFLSATKNGEQYRSACEQAFVSQGREKYLADLYQLATIALRRCNIHGIYGGGFCTVSEPERFFSYRREKITGRMASFIFIA